MNRKLLSGFMLLAVAAGGVGTFTSCKDSEEDFRTDVLVGQKNLQDQIDAIRFLTDGTLKENLRKWLDEQDWNDQNGKGWSIQDLVYGVSKLQGDLTALENRVKILEQKEYLTQQDIDSILEVLKKEIKKDYDALAGRVTALEDWKTLMSNMWTQEVYDMIIVAYGQAMANNDAIKALDENVTRLNVAIGELANTVAKNYADLLSLINSNYDELLQMINNLGGGDLPDDVDLSEIYKDLQSLNDNVNLLWGFLNEKFASFITSLEVSQTYNGIFGTINLPLGVESRMIGNYYYNSDHNVSFPYTPSRNSKNYEYNPDSNVLNQETFDQIVRIFGDFITINANTPVVDDMDNNLGELYVTVNPGNVDANGFRAQLVNSQDEAILTHSGSNNGYLQLQRDRETVLNFGVTRANENNLYRVPVRLDANWQDISQIAYDFENKSELVAAVRDLLKNHQISDFATIGKVIYENMHDVMPAYALKISWQDPTGFPYSSTDDETVGDGTSNTLQYGYEENSVYSAYNIAAATFRPLSYRTAFGFHVDEENLLPDNFSPISQYFQEYWDKVKEDLDFDITGVLHFNLTPVTIDRITIGDVYVDIDLSGLEAQCANGDKCTFPEGTIIRLTYTGEDGLTSTDKDGNIIYNNGALNNLINQLVSQFNGSLADAEGAINQAIANLVQGINDDIASFQGRIDQNLANLKNKVEGILSGRLKDADSLVKLYNKLAARINNFLRDPNHYLQVMMAYSAGDGLHRMSNVLNNPTAFYSNNDGSDAIELFATSYNAELIVPSFKKYIAITNVYYPKNTEDGHYELIPGGGFDLVQLNASAGLNQIFPGRQQRIPVNVGDPKFFPTKENNLGQGYGYVYEVYYTSLDYRGYASTQKYYFTVK